MAFSVSYNSELHILEVEIKGDHGVTQSGELILKTAQAVREHNCFLILADIWEANLQLSVTELFNAPQRFSETFSTQDVRIQKVKRAIVVSDYLATMKFLEDVATNRGQSLKIFKNIDDARAWLQT